MIVEHGLRGLHASPSSENADGAPLSFPRKRRCSFGGYYVEVSYLSWSC